jgi:hypothetical protein
MAEANVTNQQRLLDQQRQQHEEGHERSRFREKKAHLGSLDLENTARFCKLLDGAAPQNLRDAEETIVEATPPYLRNAARESLSAMRTRCGDTYNLQAIYESAYRLSSNTASMQLQNTASKIGDTRRKIGATSEPKVWLQQQRDVFDLILFLQRIEKWEGTPNNDQGASTFPNARGTPKNGETHPEFLQRTDKDFVKHILHKCVEVGLGKAVVGKIRATGATEVQNASHLQHILEDMRATQRAIQDSNTTMQDNIKTFSVLMEDMFAKSNAIGIGTKQAATTPPQDQSCFKCNQSGHWQKDCPNGAYERPAKRQKVQCALCDSSLHPTERCNQAFCTRCAKNGHLAKFCQKRTIGFNSGNPNGQGSRGQQNGGRGNGSNNQGNPNNQGYRGQQNGGGGDGNNNQDGGDRECYSYRNTGSCRFGQRCRFNHTVPQRPNNNRH